MSLCKGLILSEVETDIFYSTLNEEDGKRLLLQYPSNEETLNKKREYFEEDGTGWWSDEHCGWIYPHNKYDFKYLQGNGAVWKGKKTKKNIMRRETTTPPTYADYIGEYYYVLLLLSILVLLYSFSIME